MLKEKMTWKLFCFSSTNLIFILLSLLHFVGNRGFPTVDPFGDTDGLVGMGCVCCQTGVIQAKIKLYAEGSACKTHLDTVRRD